MKEKKNDARWRQGNENLRQLHGADRPRLHALAQASLPVAKTTTAIAARDYGARVHENHTGHERRNAAQRKRTSANAHATIARLHQRHGAHAVVAASAANDAATTATKFAKQTSSIDNVASTIVSRTQTIGLDARINTNKQQQWWWYELSSRRRWWQSRPWRRRRRRLLSTRRARSSLASSEFIYP